MYCQTVTFDSPAHLISYTLNFYSGIIHVSDFNIYQTNTSTRHPYFYLSMTFGNMKNSNLQLEKVTGQIHIQPHKELLSDIR